MKIAQPQGLTFTFSLITDGSLRKGVTLRLMSDWLGKLVFAFLTMPTEYQQDQKALKKYVLQFVIPSLFTEQT